MNNKPRFIQTLKFVPAIVATLLAGAMSMGSVHAQGMSSQNKSPHAAHQAHGAMHKADGMSADAGQGAFELKESMNKAMQSMQQMGMSGDVDKDFAMMMKMHHEQAVDMAKIEVQHGKSPELKAMAKKIIKDQTREIAQLDQWIKMHP